jgi:ATP-binding cassette subfamily B protein
MPNPRSLVSTKKAALFLLSYVRKHSLVIATGMALLVAVDLLQLLIPQIVRSTVDLLGEEHFSRGLVLINSAKIAGLALGMVVLRFFWRMCIMGHVFAS